MDSYIWPPAGILCIPRVVDRREDIPGMKMIMASTRTVSDELGVQRQALKSSVLAPEVCITDLVDKNGQKQGYGKVGAQVRRDRVQVQGVFRESLVLDRECGLVVFVVPAFGRDRHHEPCDVGCELLSVVFPECHDLIPFLFRQLPVIFAQPTHRQTLGRRVCHRRFP